MKAPAKGPICAADDCTHPAAYEMTFDGVGYCMRHGNKIIKRIQEVKDDLKRYREYQESAYGAVAASQPVQQLQDRLRELNNIPRDNVSDLRAVRLDAEALAISRELAGRKATV